MGAPVCLQIGAARGRRTSRCNESHLWSAPPCRSFLSPSRWTRRSNQFACYRSTLDQFRRSTKSCIHAEGPPAFILPRSALHLRNRRASCSRSVAMVANRLFRVAESKMQLTELNLPRSSARIFITGVLVFGGWSECDKQPHAATITGPSRQLL